MYVLPSSHSRKAHGSRVGVGVIVYIGDVHVVRARRMSGTHGSGSGQRANNCVKKPEK